MVRIGESTQTKLKLGAMIEYRGFLFTRLWDQDRFDGTVTISRKGGSFRFKIKVRNRQYRFD